MKLIEVAFFTKNVKGVIDFYEKFLGMKPVTRSKDVGHFQLRDVKILIHEDGKHPEPGWPANVDHIAFRVQDVDDACDELKSRGLKPEVGPSNFPWGRSAYFRDPDGRMVELNRPPDWHRHRP